MASSSSSRRLPHLPLETQAAILRFCDVSTLAVSSRVCLAWLELAGPILYEHITIKGKSQLETMIRSETVLASIGPFVSLDQTRTFTYVTLEEEEEHVSERLATSSVRLEELIVDLRELPLHTGAFDLSVFLSSFDPLRLHVIAFTQPYGTEWLPVLLNLPPALPWSQIRRVTFTNAGGSDFLAKFAYLADRSPPLDIVYDFTYSGADEDGLRALLLDVRDDLIDREVNPREGPMFGAVHLWLDFEEDVALARKWLVGCSCTSLEIGVKSILDS